MANLYKEFTPESAETRNTTSLSESESTQVSTILNSFITYFKNKHL